MLNFIKTMKELLVIILNPLSIGYISGQAKGKRQKVKGKREIDNQSLITGFSIIVWAVAVTLGHN